MTQPRTVRKKKSISLKQSTHIFLPLFSAVLASQRRVLPSSPPNVRLICHAAVHSRAPCNKCGDVSGEAPIRGGPCGERFTRAASNLPSLPAERLAPPTTFASTFQDLERNSRETSVSSSASTLTTGLPGNAFISAKCFKNGGGAAANQAWTSECVSVRTRETAPLCQFRASARPRLPIQFLGSNSIHFIPIRCSCVIADTQISAVEQGRRAEHTH